MFVKVKLSLHGIRRLFSFSGRPVGGSQLTRRRLALMTNCSSSRRVLNNSTLQDEDNTVPFDADLAELACAVATLAT